jgi:hypothetical protein
MTTSFSLVNQLQAFAISPNNTMMGFVLNTDLLLEKDVCKFSLCSKTLYHNYGKKLWREHCPLCHHWVSFGKKKNFISKLKGAIKRGDRLPTLNCEGSEICKGTLKIYGHLKYSTMGPSFERNMFTKFQYSQLEWYRFVDETARQKWLGQIKDMRQKRYS